MNPSLVCVVHECHEVPGQRTRPLAPHRVAFVRHGRRADLGLFEGLFQLLYVLESIHMYINFVSSSKGSVHQAKHSVKETATFGKEFSRNLCPPN